MPLVATELGLNKTRSLNGNFVRQFKIRTLLFALFENKNSSLKCLDQIIFNAIAYSKFYFRPKTNLSSNVYTET